MMFEKFRNRMAYKGATPSEMARRQSNLIMEQTFTRDIAYRQVYVVRVESGLPTEDMCVELIDMKFNVKSYSNVDSDDISYYAQFRMGASKEYPEIAVGSYIYMQNEEGDWEWWLICFFDDRPQFRQFQIMKCDWTLGWVVDGKVYHTLGVQVKGSVSNAGIDDGARISVVSGNTVLWLPTNADTCTLTYNQRVLISDEARPTPLAWIVALVNDTNPLGLTKIKFEQTTYNPSTDNATLMLADYNLNAITPTDEAVSSTVVITYSGTKPAVKVGGGFKVFTATFGTVGEIPQLWSVNDGTDTVVESNGNYTIQISNTQLKLKVAQKYNLIGTVLTIQVTGSNGSVGSVKVEVIG